MGRVKVDLSLVSLNQLCILTGKQSRTLKTILSGVTPDSTTEPGTLLYVPSEVLPLIYARPVDTVLLAGTDELSDGETVMKLNPLLEKARLDRLRGDKVEIEIEVLKGNLLPRESVAAGWQKLVGNVRARILGLPAKIAPRAAGAKDAKEAEKLLRAECFETLKELSEYHDGLNRIPNARNA